MVGGYGWIVRVVRFRQRVNLLVFFVSAVVLVWCVLLFAAPLALPPGTVRGLDGTVGVTDHGGFSGLPPLWGVVYSVGDRLCHQIEDRSFVVGGNEMAFCARCTGVWLGLFLGLLGFAVIRVPDDGRLAWMVVLGLVPLMVDGGGQFFGWWISVNAVRLVTGLLAGLVGGVCFGLLISEVESILKKKRTT